MTSTQSRLSLTMIYHALKEPKSRQAKECQAQLVSASVKVMDHTFCQWQQYAQQLRWPISKLVRCLDYILIQGIKSSPNGPDILKLSSLSHCITWLLRFPSDPVQLQSQVKCLFHLLEPAEKTVLKAFCNLQGPQKLMTILDEEETFSGIRYYCLRGLAIENLVRQVDNAPSRLIALLDRLIEDDQAVMVARLLDQADPKDCMELIPIWSRTLEQYSRDQGTKRQTGLLYGLTHTVYKTATVSLQARQALLDIQTDWFEHLVHLSGRWCHVRIFDESASLPKEEDGMLVKMLNIVRVVGNTLPQRIGYERAVKQTVELLTCFFMAFLCQGAIAERQVFMQWLDYNLCVEMNERDSAMNGETLQRFERLLALLMDIYIQYIQLLPQAGKTISSSSVLAWCLKSFLLVLHSHDPEEKSRLLPRLKKLVIFHLHNPMAIEVLSGAPKVISHAIWQPTIDLARDGLKMVADLSDEALKQIKVFESVPLFKADRAFASLNLIAKSTRGCERLVEGNILELVDLAKFTWSDSLLMFYARFMRLMVTLAERSAFIRVRMRDESQLFPMIKTLLNTAIEHTTTKDGSTLIQYCLLVIGSFQYDETSMIKWLSDDSVVLPILYILFPWLKEERVAETDEIQDTVKASEGQMMFAAFLLKQILAHSLCVRQVIERPLALINLCKMSLHRPAFHEVIDEAAACILAAPAIRVPILSNAYTGYFKAIVQRPRFKSKVHHSLCRHLYSEKMQALQTLYGFSQTDNDNVLKLNEMTAVAIGYATIGSPANEWNQALDESVMTTLCQMLMSQEITLRRETAAQLLEILVLDFEWSRPEQASLAFESVSTSDCVWFVIEGERVKGNRVLLRLVSPIFSALLSKDYVESEMQEIPLYDVTFHSFKNFIDILDRLNAQEPVAMECPWASLVDVLQIADQFGCEIVKRFVENWVLQHIDDMEAKTEQERRRCLEGLVGLYRECRDPMEQDGGISSPTWPFARLLDVGLKTLLQYMTETCQTDAFLTLIQHGIDELESFYIGIISLLRKAEQ